MEFSEKLYRLRIARGIYQKQLAAWLHVSVGTVSNYENGIHSPDLKTLGKIADYFNVSVEYLLGRTEYTGSINSLETELAGQYTALDIAETAITLTPPHREDLAHYIRLLKLADDAAQ